MLFPQIQTLNPMFTTAIAFTVVATLLSLVVDVRALTAKNTDKAIPGVALFVIGALFMRIAALVTFLAAGVTSALSSLGF